MPLPPQSELSPAGMPKGGALFAPGGRDDLLAAAEARLSEAAGVWRMRLLARDLIGALGPAVERALGMLGEDAVLLVAVYPGHPEGAAEGEELGRYFSSLSRFRYSIAQFRMLSFGDCSHLLNAGMEPSFSGRFRECYTNEYERKD